MKKFLSLVLALVMTMSLVTVSAGAKGFSDNSKITYKEAVDVMSAVGVIDGYTDGSFNPTATLTRGAAAKIICNLILGPTTANALVADAAPYKDVPTNNTFAGYIAYCQKEGIISGYADGTFKPANTLTGYAFMKMLLGALGYDASREGYTGANWSISVGKRALNAGLADGLVGDFNGVKAVTREEACLYAFNMLQADMVEYEKNSTITVGNVTVTDNSAAKSKRWSSSSVNDGNIDSKGGDGYVQFAEEYFNKLVKESDIADDFGRPATKWTYKGVKVGTYSKTADVTYTENVKLGTIYADLKMSDKDEKAVVYVDGVEGDTFANVKKGNDLKLGDVRFNATSDCNVGNGTLTEVFLDRDANKVTIVCINTYVAEVNKTIAATKSKDAYITLSAITGSVAPGDEFKTTGFESDDIVLYTYAKGDIQSVEKAESVNGALNKIVTGKKVTIGDKEYKYSNNYSNKDALNIESEYDVFLDKYGYAIYTRETEYTIADYAFLRQLDTANNVFGTDKAALLTVDAKYKTVDTKKDYTTGLGSTSLTEIGATGAHIVIAKETSNGEYRLSSVSGTVNKSATAVSDDFVMKSGVAQIKVDSSTKIYANSKTVFVVVKTDAYGQVVSKTAYTGINNAPTIKAKSGSTTGLATTYYCRNTDIATVMFINVDTTKYDVTAGNQDVIFFSPESASKKTEDKDDVYYTYSAVVDGKITEVKVAADVNIDSTPSDGYMSYGNTTSAHPLVYTGATYTDGVITDLTTLTNRYATVTGTAKLDGEYNVKLGGKNFVVASDAKVFFLDDDGVITEGNIKSVRNSDTDIATYTVKDGQVTNLFIQQYFENNASSGSTVVAPGTVTALTYNNSTGVVSVTGSKAGKYTVTVEVLSNGTYVEAAAYTVNVTSDGATATVAVGTLTAGNARILCGGKTVLA